MPVWKSRKKESHKGDNGKLLIIGGSEDYIGCLYLAGIAALRIGCDYVMIAAPEKTAWALNTLSPDLITKKFNCKHFTKKHISIILKLAERFDVILIGNGLGSRSRAFARSIIRKVDKPKIIDADAIASVSLADSDNCIFTPHMTEFKTLLKNSGIKQEKVLFATIKKIQNHLKDNIILLKGPTDYIISKDKITKNTTGNAGMTKAGTGDVLAGLVAGLIAQGMPHFQACRLAAKINGDIGDTLKKKKGYSFLASDLLKEIKKAKYLK